jgi:O-antigen/teichoic acid export membrane protein
VSQQRTLLNRLNIRKNVFFAMGEFIINMALVFFSYRLIIQQGGLEAVGVWSTLYAWTNLVRLGDVGVSGAAVRFLALWDVTKQRENIRTYGETALLTSIVQFCVLALIAYFALSPLVERIVGNTHAPEALKLLPWLLFGFFLLNVSGTALGLLQGLHHGYLRSQLSVLGTTIQLVAVLVFVPTWGILGLAFAQILQHGVLIALGWSLVRRKLACGILPWRFDIPAFRAMLGYSIKAQVVNIANGLIEPITKMLVGHFGGMAAQGLFELAYKSVLLPRNFIGAGVTATIPAMASMFKENRDELRQLYARAFRLSIFAMGLAAIVLVIFAPIASLLWLGRVDTTYWLYVGFLAAGYFFNVIGIPAYVLGMSSGYMRNNLIITLTTLLGLVTIGSFLGSINGSNGVVLSSAITTGLGGVAICYANGKLIN